MKKFYNNLNYVEKKILKQFHNKLFYINKACNENSLWNKRGGAEDSVFGS